MSQCTGLREYLNERGGKLSTENSPKGSTSDLEDIIGCLDVAFEKADDPQDLESILNSVVSLLIQVAPHDPMCHKLIASFCQALVTAGKGGPITLRVLNNLYEGIGEGNKSLRFEVFVALVRIAGSLGQIRLVVSDISQIKIWATYGLPTEKYQDLFRLLHEILLKNKDSELAAQVMVELLASYTEETASQARSDAHKCIVSSLADPNTFLLDHLLTLKPVKILEGEPIHALLTIFVKEQLPAYINFYNSNKQFVDSLGLNHDSNLKKMRLLTFMQMSERMKEITFDTIKSELQINEESVESFVIDVLKTRLVKAKIDQLNRKVNVTSTMHRTFGKAQWIQLKETLTSWNNSLQKVKATVTTVLPKPPIQVVKKPIHG